MYAVIRTGGKQYRVAPEDVLEIEKLAGEAGDTVEFGEVLMVGGDKPQIGSPLVDGAKVAAELVEHFRGDKVIIFKKKRRSTYRRKRGHRQDLTRVRITDIMTDGAKASKAAKSASADKTEAAAKEAPAKEKTAKAEAGAEKKPAAKAKKPAAKKEE